MTLLKPATRQGQGTEGRAPRGAAGRCRMSGLVPSWPRCESRTALPPAPSNFSSLPPPRTGETLGATWNEVDMGAKLWTIPAGRMKAGRNTACVPLSDATFAVLQQVRDIGHSDYVFPGGRDRRPLSETSLLMLLRRMGHGDITAHGFRSTFRDWAAERTNFPREVAEMALAHAIPDAAEAAYRRGDLFDKRRKLMDAWAAYCAKVETDAGKVVALARARTPR
jgi:hypothetical protein